MHRALIPGLGLLLAIGLVTACRDAERPPDVLLLLVDTLRADHTSLHGYSRDTTPELARFAREAVVFDEAVAAAPWTLPSVASLFTSTPPSLHGLRARRGVDQATRLGSALPTLAEAFADAGYRTVAIVANPWVDTAANGLQRGFEEYQSADGQPASQLDSQVREALEKDDPRPVLLYVHYMDVHGPYRLRRDASEPELGPLPAQYRRQLQPFESDALPRYLRAENVSHLGIYVDAYDRGIRRWDTVFGRLIEWLRETGRLERSVVSVTSDHGEEFLEHGGWHHGSSLYPEQIRVPWVISAPGLAPARISDRAVSGLDIAPTLLARAGIRAPERMLGRDALEPSDPERPVYAETHIRPGFVLRREPIVAMQRGHRKWITGMKGGAAHCFDRRADPAELRPGPCDPEQIREIRSWTGQMRKAGEALGELQHFRLDPEAAARLQELGYTE